MEQRTKPSSQDRKTLLLDVPGCFSLLETVRSHGWSEVRPFTWCASGASLERVDPEGSILITQPGPGRLSVDCLVQDRGAAERARTLLNLDQDLGAFHLLCAPHPRLSWVPDRGAGWFLRGRDAWEDASKAVCFTNIAWRQAARCIDRIAEAGREGCWPSPGALLEHGADWLREHGRVGYRARYLEALAQGFVEGRFSLDEEERSGFLAMPGIGPSTATYLAGLRGAWERISYDSSVAWLLREGYGIPEPSPADADRLFEPFGPYRGLACLLDLHETARLHG